MKESTGIARIKRGFVILSADTPVSEAAKICKDTNAKHILVSADGKLVGIVTPVDFVYKVLAESKDPNVTPLKSIMSSPVVTCMTSDDILTVAKTMAENRYSVLPVVSDHGTVEGIISITDVLYALSEAHLSEEARELAKKLVLSTLHGVRLTKK